MRWDWRNDRKRSAEDSRRVPQADPHRPTPESFGVVTSAVSRAGSSTLSPSNVGRRHLSGGGSSGGPKKISDPDNNSHATTRPPWGSTTRQLLGSAIGVRLAR